MVKMLHYNGIDCGRKQTNLCLYLTHSFLHWHLTALLNELSSAEQLHISII